jgi:hypothetical protein
MSIVTKSIVNADAEARYLSPGELDRIKAFVGSGAARLRIAETLSGARESIVKQAGDRLFQKRPDIVSPGGNAYGQREYNQCLRDYGWYLRLITYGVLSGNKEPIEKIGLIGVKEMYNSLDVPVPGMVEAIRFLKEAALGQLNAEDAQEAAPYFDYIIQTMS